MSLRLVAALALLVACATEPYGETAETPSVDHEARVVAPLRASLVGPERPEPGSRIKLVLQLKRAASFSVPVTVSVQLPPGVRRADAAKAAAALAIEPGVDELVLELDLTSLPREDLRLTLDARTPAAGFHQELRYRFGRPAAAVVPPRLRSANLTVGGRSWGPSVDVSAQR